MQHAIMHRIVVIRYQLNSGHQLLDSGDWFYAIECALKLVLESVTRGRRFCSLMPIRSSFGDDTYLVRQNA